MCVVAKTQGPAAIDLRGALENYWKACNFDITTSQEGGWVVRRPDFSVVQISLQALREDERRLAALRRWLVTTRVRQVRQMATALAHELKRLMEATDPSEAKMFLNVAGGAAESEELAAVTKELASAGLQSTIMLSPLLLKTSGKKTAARGGQSIVLPMPILVKSTYGVIQKATRQAYETLAAGDDDPEMADGTGQA